MFEKPMLIKAHRTGQSEPSVLALQPDGDASDFVSHLVALCPTTKEQRYADKQLQS
jgi:hypothetical protein